MFKTSLKYGVILFIAASVCALFVSTVFVIVDPIIIERTIEKVRDNLNSLYSEVTFEYKETSNNYDLSKVSNADALYEIYLNDSEINYVYQMSPEGRNDQIIFLVSYDELGNVKKIQYVQMRETKGRGDKITKDDFLNMVYNQTAQDMDVDLIAGATYSSKAMKQSLEDSSKHLISEVLK